MMAVTDLQKLAPSIEWKTLLADTGTPPVTELNVTYPDFFKGINALIESTDLDTIKTYLRVATRQCHARHRIAGISRRGELQFLRHELARPAKAGTAMEALRLSN